MARVSLDYLKANRPQVDQAKIDDTTESDIRQQMVEDGHDPDAEPVGYRAMPSPADIRAKLGLTQVAFANALGVPAATLRNWEQGRKQPDPAARSLLTIFDREPEAAMRALDLDMATTAKAIEAMRLMSERIAREMEERALAEPSYEDLEATSRNFTNSPRVI